MQTTIIVTAPPKTGNLFRVTSAIRKLGYKLRDSRSEKSFDGLKETFFLTFATPVPVTQDTLAQLREYAPFVIDVTLEKSVEKQMQAPVSQVEKVIAQPAIAEAGAELNFATDTIDEIVERESKYLIDVYPNITQHIASLEAKYLGEQNAEIMHGIGDRLGRFAAQPHVPKKKRGFFNRTVQQSLSMNQPQFGGLPVIDDLMSTSKNTKKRTASATNEHDVLVNELNQFLIVRMDGTTLVVEDCPHCLVHDSAEVSACEFVAGFAQRFTAELKGKQTPAVRQLASQSVDGNGCRFEL